MKQIVVLSLAVLIAALMLCASMGCRIRTVEPDEYNPSIAGHLNPVEARQLITRLMAKHQLKLAYNAKLDFRGLKINADGWDFNMSIGYVYLITPPEGAKVNFEVPRRPSAEELKLLDKMEKVQHTYILWVTEGDEASITAEVEAFMDKLYKTGALARAREPKKPDKPDKKEGDGDTKTEGPEKKDEGKDGKKDDKDDEPKKKPEKSKVMQMIEKDDDSDDKKPDRKKDED